MSPTLASLPPACIKRLPEVAEAMSALRVWLNDLLQAGLASPLAQSPVTFEGMARRLVDAQAPGAARLVRRAGSSSLTQEERLEVLGRIAILLDAFDQRMDFDLDFQLDLWLSLGVTFRKDEIGHDRHLNETWGIAAQRVFPEENLLVQRSWIYGWTSDLWLVHLSYQVNAQPFNPNLRVGTALQGVVGRYPGALQMRGVFLSQEEVPFQAPPAGSIREMQVRAVNFLSRFPLVEAHFGAMAIAGFAGERGGLIGVDHEGSAVPLELTESQEFRLLAVSGGGECRLYGEWDGARFRPSTAAYEGGFTLL